MPAYRKPKTVCLKCQRPQGVRADTSEKHLDACYLRAGAAAAGGPAVQQGGEERPAAAAAGDRVLVLRAEAGKTYSMTILARPDATFRQLHKLLLRCWMDCGCGHLWGFTRLVTPATGPWPKRRQPGQTDKQSSHDELAILQLQGEQFKYFYDMGNSSGCTIEVRQLDRRLSAAGAEWLGSRTMGVAMRNEHPSSTGPRCACGGLMRYCAIGAFCSLRCGVRGLRAPDDLRMVWNSPRMGCCAYDGPDDMTPDSFWPQEEVPEPPPSGSESDGDDDGEEADFGGFYDYGDQEYGLQRSFRRWARRERATRRRQQQGQEQEQGAGEEGAGGQAQQAQQALPPQQQQVQQAQQAQQAGGQALPSGRRLPSRGVGSRQHPLVLASATAAAAAAADAPQQHAGPPTFGLLHWQPRAGMTGQDEEGEWSDNSLSLGLNIHNRRRPASEEETSEEQFGEEEAGGEEAASKERAPEEETGVEEAAWVAEEEEQEERFALALEALPSGQRLPSRGVRSRQRALALAAVAAAAAAADAPQEHAGPATIGLLHWQPRDGMAGQDEEGESSEHSLPGERALHKRRRPVSREEAEEGAGGEEAAWAEEEEQQEGFALAFEASAASQPPKTVSRRFGNNSRYYASVMATRAANLAAGVPANPFDSGTISFEVMQQQQALEQQPGYQQQLEVDFCHAIVRDAQLRAAAGLPSNSLPADEQMLLAMAQQMTAVFAPSQQQQQWQQLLEQDWQQEHRKREECQQRLREWEQRQAQQQQQQQRQQQRRRQR